MTINKNTIDRLNSRYGNWALVTGATSGIGKAISYQLAEAGFNLVITGRRAMLLNTIATELTDRFSIDVLEVSGDLSNEEDLHNLTEKTDELPIGIVILNAGFGTSGKLMNADISTELNLIDLNCKAVLLLSHHFVNQMGADSRKGASRKGAIVLLSSMVSFQGVPNAANYAASKAYVQTLGEAMSRELKPEGIDVLCAAPGPVGTEFADRANMRMGSTMKAETIAAEIIRSIGRKTTVLPGFLTKFLVFNLRLLPRWGKIRVMEKVMSGFTSHQ
ncbi:MAG: SDR family NAD(P)-dependent oxidoreductase [Bacteroidota bacterium]